MENDLDMRIQKEKEIAFESLNYTISNNLNNNILDKAAYWISKWS